ncbi:helix-turn-helix domain-containing protein [Sphaerisporangium rubeum]|uniref:Transcriptional regulator with XRE-family HTH domain n=2 Tax=Sphaerisporangium rubeum TaxID=321317 RepID=A0A7X0M618_9ACTN|nr:helix-turn-helix transcriptional regulator [Sphaerisporangium rubeum]MBB6471411.1 transcriptional regulator with XRE-family HTH domain [Sphaerisporangium rubeum]
MVVPWGDLARHTAVRDEVIGLTMGSSPTVRRRRLASELRRIRKEKGLTAEAVADRLELDPSWVSRIETGRRGIRAIDLRALLDVYEIHGDARDELLTLARQARQRGWWHTYGDVVPEWFQVFVGLEAEAAEVRSYHSELIPGLLQTPEYYGAFLATAATGASTEEITRKIDFRVARQERVTGDNPLKLWVIVNEAAVRRPVGGADVMRAQLQHLIEMSRRPNVTLQVLPFSAGPHPAMDGGFVSLGFPEAPDPDVVYLENQVGAVYLEERVAIDRYNLVFNHLRARALDPDQTRNLLARVSTEGWGS